MDRCSEINDATTPHAPQSPALVESVGTQEPKQALAAGPTKASRPELYVFAKTSSCTLQADVADTKAEDQYKDRKDKHARLHEAHARWPYDMWSIEKPLSVTYRRTVYGDNVQCGPSASALDRTLEDRLYWEMESGSRYHLMPSLERDLQDMDLGERDECRGDTSDNKADTSESPSEA
ncbi:hypothetical protein EIP91_007781 [Steccherinum ochraceum]|uniref:Uncharacterized protein n=1 Tax=Steccherinum ochraceum TaxID=92696 RepID=A0A4R0RC20_9APHY|nr:hypothetical protein EIP91_007781 [Steccherinum ochraceum]